MNTRDDIVNSPSAGADAGSAAVRPTGGWGAEPSNTAPHNYIPLSLKVLRIGVDSLYLSVRGKLFEDWYGCLVVLKEKAQSPDLAERAKAQVKIGDHLFEVKDRGTRFYAFILEDNAYQIKLGKGDTVPLAYVQVRAEYLAFAKLDAVLADLRFILNTVGLLRDDFIVSRADLCFDFVPPCSLDWPERAWITRARLIEPHYYHHRLSGWSFGRGSNMSGRLYNKLLEIVQKSHALYWFELWKARGWIDGEDVWRLEGQFEREVLEQLGIRSPASLIENLQGLWRYFTEDWLRLAIPNECDHNPTRWPTHPFWLAASAIPWGLDDQPRLKRFRPQRIPRDERLFPAALGYLASFMAREGIEDFGEGVGEFLTQMRAFMDIKGRPEGKGCEQLLEDRRLAKGRLFNTIDNTRLSKKELDAQAEVYRRAQDGEDGIL